MAKNPKNKFYRYLKLDKNFWDIIKFYNSIKKEMLKDCDKKRSK